MIRRIIYRPVIPKRSSSEEDQVDVVEVQSEGKDHHEYKRKAVHNQSGHPAKQQHKHNKPLNLFTRKNMLLLSSSSEGEMQLHPR